MGEFIEMASHVLDAFLPEIAPLHWSITSIVNRPFNSRVLLTAQLLLVKSITTASSVLVMVTSTLPHVTSEINSKKSKAFGRNIRRALRGQMPDRAGAHEAGRPGARWRQGTWSGEVPRPRARRRKAYWFEV